jgi:hypothetical protein
MSKRHDTERLLEAHDKIRNFAAELQVEHGFPAPMIVDALMASGINSAILISGYEATANCLAEWVERVRQHQEVHGARRLPRYAKPGERTADELLDEVLENFRATGKGN